MDKCIPFEECFPGGSALHMRNVVDERTYCKLGNIPCASYGRTWTYTTQNGCIGPGNHQSWGRTG